MINKNPNTPLVSIVIPTYNQEKYITDSVKSALNQSYSNIEIIVSDDGSTDNTEERVSKFYTDKRVKYYKNESNLGRVKNYNKALYEHAKGEYILNLDGDDYLIDNNYIEDAIYHIQKNNLQACFADQTVFFERDKREVNDTMNKRLPPIVDGNWFFTNYYKGYSLPHLSFLYKRSHALEVGFYTKDVLSSDWESFLKFILGQKIGYLERAVGVWRKHDTNESATKDVEKHLENIEYIESVFCYAQKTRYFTIKEIEKWRERMLKRYFAKLIIRAQLLERKEQSVKIQIFICKYDNKIYKSLQYDLRLIALKILLINKNFQFRRFIFRKILKIESFLQ